MISDAQLVEQYLKLKAYAAVLIEGHKAELKPYHDGMEIIENAFLARLNERGADNTKTEHGTAYKSRLMNVKVVDRNAVLKFCMDNWSTIGSDLLQVGATKDAVKQWIESKGEPPPGIEVSHYININIRKS
jgi:hypothetical protein